MQSENMEAEIRKVVNKDNSLSTIWRKIDFVAVALDMAVTSSAAEDHVLIEGAPMILSDCLVELMEVRNAVDALRDAFGDRKTPTDRRSKGQ